MSRNNIENGSRRKFLKVTGGASLALAAPMIITSRKAAAAQELTMLAWYGHGEPDIVAEFEAANDVKITPKYYTGGDNMMALVAQSPVGTYDLILSDAEYTTGLQQAGFVAELTPDDYPLDDYWPEYQEFPGNWSDGKLYSLIVRFGYLGLSFNTDVLSEAEARSYDALWSEKVSGKVGHFDWHLPNLGCLSLKDGNREPGPYDITADQWSQLKDTTMSLKSQVRGFYDYGGTLSSLRNGDVTAMCGIGDWITGLLQRDGAPVATVVPDEGGIQWSECYCIGKDSKNHELAKKFIQYITSAEGQVKSSMMAAYPALSPIKSGWELLNENFPDEAKRQGMLLSERNIRDDYKEGKIKFRSWPVNQSLEEWNDFWSEYKNA